MFFVWIKESQLTFLNFIRYVHVGFQLQLILNVIIFNTLFRIAIGELLTGKIRVVYNALMFETDDQVPQLTCELYKSHNRPIRSLRLNWNKLCLMIMSRNNLYCKPQIGEFENSLISDPQKGKSGWQSDEQKGCLKSQPEPFLCYYFTKKVSHHHVPYPHTIPSSRLTQFSVQLHLCSLSPELEIQDKIQASERETNN